MRARLRHLLDWAHFHAEADTQQHSVPEAQSGRSHFAVKGAEKLWQL